MANNYDLIAEAIKGKLQVTAYYQGYYREMCPHALGKKEVNIKHYFINLEGVAVKVL
ncbi:hypothetical protein ACFRB5_004549 [Salmonella enterica]